MNHLGKTRSYLHMCVTTVHRKRAGAMPGLAGCFQRYFCQLIFVWASALVWGGTCGLFAQETDRARQDTQSSRCPNIVVILADDAGYSDFSFKGSQEISTPNLDKLCRSGVDFTQAYAPAPVCTPSRAGLLTGRQPCSIGAEKNLRSKLHANHLKCGLDKESLTIAERLKTLNYATALIGKWHLGYGGAYHPNERGFDLFHGMLAGSRDYFALSQEEAERPATLPHRLQTNGQILPESEVSYVTDQFTDKAIEFMENNQKKPFFLFLSYSAVHSPYQAKRADLDQHSHMPPARRKIGAMVSNLDQNVGRVMETLERLKLHENTLLVFTNDNGGTTAMNNLPYRGHKGQLYEGGIRVPMLVRMPGKIAAGTRYDNMVTLLDLFPTCLAAAGVEPDGSRCDGVNLFDFLDNDKQPHDELFFRFHSQAAIRKGDYKFYESPKKKIRALFNIAKDPYENSNLIDSNPELAAKLKMELDQWQERLPEQHW